MVRVRIGTAMPEKMRSSLIVALQCWLFDGDAEIGNRVAVVVAVLIYNIVYYYSLERESLY